MANCIDLCTCSWLDLSGGILKCTKHEVVALSLGISPSLFA